MSFSAQPTGKSGHRSDAHGYTPDCVRDAREATRRSNPPTTCQLCDYFKDLGRTTEKTQPPGGWSQLRQKSNKLSHNKGYHGCDKGVLATFGMRPANAVDGVQDAFVMIQGTKKRGRPPKDEVQRKKVRFTMMGVLLKSHPVNSFYFIKMMFVR